MAATWQDGLVLESDDGDYRVQLGTFIRFDGRFVPGGGLPGNANQFLMRTVRATFQGRLAKYFAFRLQPDFSGSGPTIADAWGDVAFSDALHVRLGRDKVPIGLEVLLQDSNVLFLERGLTVNLLPSRDTGAQVYGDLRSGDVSYQLGLFNGQVDGASDNSNNPDTDNSKDMVGRLAVRPFNRSGPMALRRLTLAMGGSSGHQHNAPLPTFKTSIQQTYFSYAKDAFGDGLRTRLAPQASFYLGTVGVYTEYVRMREGVSRGAANASVTSTAWQMVGSVLLTGETSGERIRPTHAFDPQKHQWGALQVTARYGSLSVGSNAFSLGLADPTSSRVAQVATVGANWFLTTNVKLLLNVERSAFDHDKAGARPIEHGVLFRMQLNY